MYIIYMHTSLDSSKSYIGLTSRTMEIRWLGFIQERELEKQVVGKNYSFNKTNLINS